MSTYGYVIVGMSASFLLSVGILLFYLKYRQNLSRQQYRMKVAEVQHQKELLHTVIASQEQERRRIGMDLHDEVGSALSSLRLMIENFVSQDRGALPAEQFNIQCKEVIDKVIVNVRHISHNLSPMVKGAYGFHDAICDFCDGVRLGGKLQVEVQFSEASAALSLPDATALALYRVITELVQNTVKHAGASIITLRFDLEGDNYVIRYADNGIGLPEGTGPGRAGGGMGLRNMESRLSMIGAEYSIGNHHDKGFRARIVLPLQTKP